MENDNINTNPVINEPSNDEKLKQLLTLIHVGLTAIREAIEDHGDIIAK